MPVQISRNETLPPLPPPLGHALGRRTAPPRPLQLLGPVPGPRGPSAAAEALWPPSPEHGSPRRGMQNDPRASSAQRCSGEQATEALEALVQPSEDRAWHAAQFQPLVAAAGQCRQSHQDSKQKANGRSCGVDFRHQNHSPANNPNPQTLPV
ncbi:uncharacterized protein LOC144377219 [Ictidomys tridecemlineatus]